SRRNARCARWMNASAKWNAVCRESWEKARATLLENDVPGGAMGRAKRLAWRDGGERGRSKASGQANRGARGDLCVLAFAQPGIYFHCAELYCPGNERGN